MLVAFFVDAPGAVINAAMDELLKIGLSLTLNKNKTINHQKKSYANGVSSPIRSNSIRKFHKMNNQIDFHFNFESVSEKLWIIPKKKKEKSKGEQK